MSQQLIESFLSSPVDDLSLVLETDRLVLEPITTDHVEKMLQILCDKALYQFIPQNPPSLESLKKTYGFWQNRKSPDSKEIWLNWAAKLKTTNEYITDHGEELEIGFFNSSIIGDVTLSSGKVYNYSFPLSEIKEVKIVDLDSKIVLQIQGTKKLDYNIVKPGSITKLESYKNSLLDTLSDKDIKVNK